MSASPNPIAEAAELSAAEWESAVLVAAADSAREAAAAGAQAAGAVAAADARADEETAAPAAESSAADVRAAARAAAQTAGLVAAAGAQAAGAVAAADARADEETAAAPAGESLAADVRAAARAAAQTAGLVAAAGAQAAGAVAAADARADGETAAAPAGEPLAADVRAAARAAARTAGSAAAGAAGDAARLADSQARARIDLAACHRLADHFGLNEGIDNHLTLLLPGHTDRFLLAPFGLHWSEVRARDFMVIDFAGRILSGRGPVEDTALYIHLPVHRLAPQARCVLHTHMPYATALCMLENPRLEMAGQSALGFYDEISYEADYNGLAFDATEGERLARALGSKSVLMMRNHGVLAVGGSVPQAFERLYFLERAAQAQVLALSTGRALHIVPEAVARATAAQFKSGSTVDGRDRAELHFEALKRRLDRASPDYAS